MEQNKVDETLETAAERNFVVALRTKGGAKKATETVVVVQAHSIAQAKRKAYNKVKKGRFKHSPFGHWEFTTVEAQSNETPIVQVED